MKVGVFVTVGHPGSDRAYLEAAGRAAESHGFDSLWVAEHVVLFDEYQSRYPYDEAGRIPVRKDAGLLGPFTVLAFLAAVADLGQGWYGFNLEPAGLAERMDKLRPLLAARGRSLSDLEISVSPYLRSFEPGMLEGYHAAGAQQVILPAFGRSRDEMLAGLEQLAATVLEPARRLAPG